MEHTNAGFTGVIIYGNMHQGSTYHCVDIFKRELARNSGCPVEWNEFCLPRDLPDFCGGCFTCFLHGEQSCPHHEQTVPIADALKKADLILLASPVYGLDVSGQMKAFIDHYCYMWLSHRPDAGMFRKVGVTVTTTAGAGLSHTAKTLKNCLKFWGVARIFSFKKAVAAMKWEDVKPEKQAAIQKELAALAAGAAGALQKARKGRLTPPLFTRILFAMMKGMMKNNTWNETDRSHWKAMGWLDGKKPF